MAKWSLADIPDQSGRRALVTGATDGLGLETALALAGKGAQVVLSGRNPQKGEAALTRIRQVHPLAEVTFEPAELGDLASVRALAERVSHLPLHLLVNNAGLMALPRREATADGFERQLGVNYLSHFALTGLLLDALRQASAPRVVSLASLAHRVGAIHEEDLQLRLSYAPFRAYAQSKLAMLMFAGELQRRSDANGWGVFSAAAHPGGSNTNLISSSHGPQGQTSAFMRVGERLAARVMQSAADGALPTLFAATAPDATPGGYYGPSGLLEIKGAPSPAKRSPASRDTEAAARLWAVSEKLTGVRYGDAA